jgi:hypothetical protein
VRADERDLIVGFNQDEELTISDPADWSSSPDTFRVFRASRVTWRWYCYGRPKQPADNDGASAVYDQVVADSADGPGLITGLRPA